MNYLLVVQVFVRTPSGSLLRGNQHYVIWRLSQRPCKLKLCARLALSLVADVGTGSAGELAPVQPCVDIFYGE